MTGIIFVKLWFVRFPSKSWSMFDGFLGGRDVEDYVEMSRDKIWEY